MPDPYEAPLPKPTPETRPYWDALRKHELHLQRCGACNEAYFYPRNFCPNCLSSDVAWFQASGRGRLHTFTIVHVTGPNPVLPVPYVLAMIELEEGPCLMSNLVGVEPDPSSLWCEMLVQIEYADVTEECTLARFRPVEGA